MTVPKFRPWKSIIYAIAIEQTTVKKIPQKLLPKCPPKFSFSSPDAYAALRQVSMAHPYHFT